LTAPSRDSIWESSRWRNRLTEGRSKGEYLGYQELG
jgi:hypothetical protein